MGPINRNYGTLETLGYTPNRSRGLCESLAHLVDRIATIVFPCLVKQTSSIELKEAEYIGYDEFELVVVETQPPTLPPPRPPPAPPQFLFRQADWFSFSKTLSSLPRKLKSPSRVLTQITDRDYKIGLRNQQPDCGNLFDETHSGSELQAEAVKWLSLPMELLRREGVIERFEFYNYHFQKTETGLRGFTFNVRLHAEGRPLAECTAQLVLLRIANIRPDIEVNLFDKIFFYSNISKVAFCSLGSAIHDLKCGRLR